ncbi:MAG: hypothetical protein H6661_07030 [Ardenticatenaceae bacterium]|nr:hypothetical protein [Ardenticatenaceae bacterium]
MSNKTGLRWVCVLAEEIRGHHRFGLAMIEAMPVQAVGVSIFAGAILLYSQPRQFTVNSAASSARLYHRARNHHTIGDGRRPRHRHNQLQADLYLEEANHCLTEMNTIPGAIQPWRHLLG